MPLFVSNYESRLLTYLDPFDITNAMKTPITNAIAAIQFLGNTLGGRRGPHNALVTFYNAREALRLELNP
jgi:hypothetical protein